MSAFVSAVIVAAGGSVRMGIADSKQFIPLRTLSARLSPPLTSFETLLKPLKKSSVLLRRLLIRVRQLSELP